MGKANKQAEEGKISIETQIHPEQGMDTKKAALFLGCSVGYLKARRMDGAGPDYYRLGAKSFYTVRALQEYRDARMVLSPMMNQAQRKLRHSSEGSGLVDDKTTPTGP